MVTMVGRWSDARRVMVRQDVKVARLDDMVVTSGEVGCWEVLKGTLVGVSVLRMIWSEFWMRSRMWEPLWSVYGEYQTSEWALRSPVVMRLFRDSK